ASSRRAPSFRTRSRRSRNPEEENDPLNSVHASNWRLFDRAGQSTKKASNLSGLDAFFSLGDAKISRAAFYSAALQPAQQDESPPLQVAVSLDELPVDSFCLDSRAQDFFPP